MCQCDCCVEQPGEVPKAPDGGATRRAFLLLGLAALGACARRQPLVALPGPPWPSPEPPLGDEPIGETAAQPAPPPDAPWRDTLVPRAYWAMGQPVASRMDRMTTIRYITVHHDGMDSFRDTRRQASADRIELIRRRHRARGWGDIGYHFVVYRGGGVWEGRPLIYQGAHVKDHNPGNVGLVLLGNFDEHAPRPAQLKALRSHLGALMETYHIPAKGVQTHQEWPGARTACPGRNLQRYLNSLRRSRQLG